MVRNNYLIDLQKMLDTRRKQERNEGLPGMMFVVGRGKMISGIEFEGRAWRASPKSRRDRRCDAKWLAIMIII